MKKYSNVQPKHDGIFFSTVVICSFLQKVKIADCGTTGVTVGILGSKWLDSCLQRRWRKIKTQGSKATFSCYFPTQTASNKICPLISAMEQEGLVVLEQKVIGYIEKVRTYHKTANKCQYGFVVFTM